LAETINKEEQEKMKNKWWMVLLVLLVLPGLLSTVGCSKDVVKSDSATDMSAEEAARLAAEKAKQEEMARQKRLEEERLKAEAAAREKTKSARDRFMNEDIYFEYDRADILPAAQDVLKMKADFLKANTTVAVTIEGHCDERGTNEYNLALGDRRAEAAKSFLMNLGIAATRMETVSYGEERPLDSGNSESAWAKNRRAHFVVQ
jgi:peptidoglycan-associated lipoprotein